jgi:hypothetical protein
MATNTGQKRYQRLGWPTLKDVPGTEDTLENLEITPSTTPNTLDDVDEMVYDRLSQVEMRSVVVILYYAREDDRSANSQAQKAVSAAEDFFFGSWRAKTYKLEDDEPVNADRLRREFDWMGAFEAALLWTSVLGKWKFLKKLGAFPRPDSHIDTDYTKQIRDLYVALGAFFCGASGRELDGLLERASVGPKTRCKLMVSMIRAAQARDAALLQKGLIKLLIYYKKSEFPRPFTPKKVSMDGTLFVHWAEKEKLPLTVPPEFADHIVRL